MKKVLLTLAAVSAVATTAAPAAAQSYNAAYRPVDARAIDQREADLVQRINNAFRRGALTRNEANRLMAELRKVEALEHRYRAGGINRWERDQLMARLDRVQNQIRQERRDDDRRYGQRR